MCLIKRSSATFHVCKYVTFTSILWKFKLNINCHFVMHPFLSSTKIRGKLDGTNYKQYLAIEFYLITHCINELILCCVFHFILSTRICNFCQPTVKFRAHYSVALQSVLLVCKCLLCGFKTSIQLCVTDKWSHFHSNRFGDRY
jgi:hypothetical protein